MYEGCHDARRIELSANANKIDIGAGKDVTPDGSPWFMVTRLLYFNNMKTIITADIHCGYPDRLSDNIWSMQTISNYASENDISKIICLGDLFHNRSHLTLDILNAVHGFFKGEPHEWIMFPGNHDMFMKNSWDVNSIRPFEKYATVYDTITTFELGDRNFIVVPFIHNEREYMETIRRLEDEHPQESVLLTHIGINNAVNNSCFLLKHWSNVNLSDVKFDLVLSGHFHNYQEIDNKIYYPGSPIPFRFDEGMVPHGFMTLDTDTLEVNFVDLRDISKDCPHDFVTITDDMMDGDGLAKFVSNNKVRVVLNKEYSKSELDNIRQKLLGHDAKSVQWMKLNKDICDKDGNNDVISDMEDPFIKWLDTQDCSKYNMDLLLKLYDNISVEAEDLFSKSLDFE